MVLRIALKTNCGRFEITIEAGPGAVCLNG